MMASTGKAPAPAAAALFLLVLGAMVVAAMRACQGHFGYPLDDAYIHMAMAKNFALHGVWGVTKYEFSSSTSSPLYTLLLAGVYKLTGVREITSLLLNAAAGVALILWCEHVFRARGMQPRLRAALLCLIVLTVPLPALALVGMEHIFHALIALMFIHLCGERIADRGVRNWTLVWIATVLLVTIRYEGVFLVGTAGVLLLLRGRWRAMAGLAVASAAPLAAYGWISVRHGWYAVPNSLLLKANVPGSESTGMFGTFLGTLRLNAEQGFHVVLLIAAAVTLIGTAPRSAKWSYGQVGLILFTATAVLHLCFARVGWFYRYESYLVALGVVTVAVALFSRNGAFSRGLKAWGYVLAGLFLLTTGYRTTHAIARAPQAVADIFGQQYQEGLFVREHLGERTVVLDDIGAVGFLSEAHILDTVGLGSRESLSKRLHKTFSDEWLNQWCRDKGAVAAITYLFVASPQWTQVATWTIPGNYMSVADTVGIYAVDPRFRSELTAGLADFRRELPRRVVEKDASEGATRIPFHAYPRQRQ